MKKKLLSLAVLGAAAIGLASCGSSTISGTYENIASQDRIVELADVAGEGDIFNAWWSMALVIYQGYEMDGYTEYNIGSKIDFSEDGTYVYTKLAVDCANFDWDYTTTGAIEYCQLVYTGTYEAGSEKNTYVLSYPSDCEWIYAAGMFTALGAADEGGKYSEGATLITPFGTMASSYDVMTSWDHELIVFLEGDPDTSFTLTVSLCENNTFSFPEVA